MATSKEEFPKPSAPSLADIEIANKFDRRLSLGSSGSTFEPSKFESPSSKVELTVSAKDLLNRDTISKSDPVCILYIEDPTTQVDWIEIDRTECVKNDLSPEWSKKFIIEYKFEKRQILRFKIYDWDGKSQTLNTHDFLGKIDCALGEIVSAPNGKFSRNLLLPSLFVDKQKPSTITIVVEEVGVCKKQLDDGSWILLHKTDRLERNIYLRVCSITSGGNLERLLKWQVFNKNQNSKLVGAKLVGEFRTSYLELVERYQGTRSPFALINRNKQSSKSDINSATGFIDICFLCVEDDITFLDHIKSGLGLSVSVAIDFTASNGDPARHTSLHYKHGGMDNPYVLAIKTVGDVIQDYSVDKRFAAFGFGAKGFPAGNRVSHNFAINFKQNNPFCDGIEGILASYYRCLKRVKLFGPTCFAPVIKEQAKIASEDRSGKKYFVLLILTDGIICDPDTTRDAIIKASELPMSIIIIGVGDEDFTEMEKLDCDGSLLKSCDGKKASRDIVQFVELKKFVNFKSINPINSTAKAALTQSVLAELPQQVCEWMKVSIR